MDWTVRFGDEFEDEFDAMPEAVQTELLARATVLKQFGPSLGRPTVDTLNGSDFNNMKELRFNAGRGVWRVAFVFDPTRTAILLVAGDKRGVDQGHFYRHLVNTADERYLRHLNRISRNRR